MEEPTAAIARKPVRGPSLRRLVWWMIWFSLAAWLLIRLPTEVSYWMLALAEKASVEGRTDEALAWVERAKEWTPKTTLPVIVKADILQQAGKLDNLSRLDLILEADLRPAERAEFHQQKSRILRRQKRWNEALAELDSAANFKGDLRPSKERLELLILARREDEARREIDQLLEASPTDADRVQLHLWKCELHQTRSEFAEALQEFDAAAELQPKLRPSVARLQLLMLARREEEAKTEADQLLRASDSDAEKAKVHLALSIIQRRQSNWAEALREFDEAARLNPELGRGGERLELLLLANRRDEAQDELDKAKQQLGKTWWRTHANINNTVAYFGALLGDDLEEALASAEKAVAYEASNPAYLDTRAYVLYALKRHEQALPDANRATELMEEIYHQQSSEELRKSLAVIVYHRSLILEALGKSAEAERDRDRVRELGFEPDQRLF